MSGDWAPLAHPMLPVSAQEPFDSPEHLFEIKWDGSRALAFVEDGRVRIVSRRGIDLTGRYPVLSGIGALPSGTVLDGEILSDGGPPSATFIAFDQLYHAYEPIVSRPLRERRRVLARTLRRATGRVVLSVGVTGAGRPLFDLAAKEGLEGIVAKRLGSRYAPGKRTRDWLKIKVGGR